MKKMFKNLVVAILAGIMLISPLMGTVAQADTGNVTRGQFAAMIAAAFGLSGEGATGFDDVASDHPFVPGILGVQANGVMVGDGTGNFLPDAYISGAEAAAILYNMIGFDGSLVAQANLNIPEWAIPAASVLVDLTMVSASLIQLPQLSMEQATQFIDAALLAFMIEPGSPYALAQHRLEDNFFGYVNRQDLATGIFHPGQIQAGTFADVAELVRQQQEQLLFGIINNPNLPVGSYEWKVRELYQMFLDNDARIASLDLLVPYFDMVRGAETIDELIELSIYLADFFTLIPYIFVNFIPDSYNNALEWAASIGEAGLSLGSRDRYESTPELAPIHEVYINLYADILYLLGETENLQERAAAIFAIEQERAARMMTVEEASSMLGIFTPVTWEEVLTAFGNIRPPVFFGEFFEEVVMEMTVYSRSLEYVAFINSLYVEENLDVLRDVALVTMFMSYMSVLDDEFARLSDDLMIILIGQAPGAMLTIEDRAQAFVTSMMWRTFSNLYAERFSSQELKDYGLAMAEEIRGTMREMIWEIEWMTEETRALSVDKLDSVTVYIAFPDEPISELDVDIRPIAEGGNLIEFLKSFTRANNDMWYHRLRGSANVSSWESIPTSTVNAFYNPTQNKIVMTAGIMQYPFFCLNNTREQNLGAYGAVIAHEFIHAFDPQGSQFDKHGTISQWWTEEDSANFAARIDDTIDWLSTLEFAGMPINGVLIVNEFVTDLGAMEVIMTLLEGTGGNQAQAMEQWAVAWSMRLSPEIAQFFMMTAVHPPNLLRTNLVISQLDEFYQIFDINPGDGMYIPADERISFWR